MIKMITLIPRKPGMSREAFIDYYEKFHVPLSARLFPDVVKRVRNYPSTDNFHYIGCQNNARVPFDAITEHWFADQAAHDRTMSEFASDPEKFRLLSEDEDQFCDKANMIMFMIEEH